jgi:virginiamycin B lyase
MRIAEPGAITAGPDGALWFTNNGTKYAYGIWRMTTTGTVTSYHGPRAGIFAPGSDGALWFTNGYFSIGRITTP